MSRRFLPTRPRLLGALLILALSACAERSYQAARLDLDFGSLPPLTFDVQEIIVEQAYAPQARPPNVEHLFELPPAKAAESWARDRLRAGGTQRRMIFEIREAPVVEAIVETEGGGGLLSIVRQTLRYEARLVIDVHLVEDDGFFAASARVTGERSVTLPESASEADRRATWNLLVSELMADVDVQLEATLSDVFESYRLP